MYVNSPLLFFPNVFCDNNDTLLVPNAIRLTLSDSAAKLSTILAELAANPSAAILDSLRGLERKTTTVFTLLKASVYSIVLEQGRFGE